MRRFPAASFCVSIVSAAALLTRMGPVLAGEEPGEPVPPAASGSAGDAASSEERIRDLEARIARLEAGRESDPAASLRMEEIEQKLARLEEQERRRAPKEWLTLGDERFGLGGKVEFNFVDSEEMRDPVLGDTDERDPRLLVDVLRLAPRIDLNKRFHLRAQVDLKPRRGQTLLKEITLRYKHRPVWWFRSDWKLGLDDRFIRMTRETENYPLAGTAFWRDESAGLFTRLRFGDKDGPPRGKKRLADERRDVAPRHPLDFERNPGEASLHLSVANVQRLDLKEVGFDDATFNEILQDDRNIFDDLALEEIGLGVGYARSFEHVGELSVLGFYYLSSLNSDSIDILRDELTLRDGLGNAIAGYGDSNNSNTYRYGFNAEYFVPTRTLLGEWLRARGSDGVTVKGQWIRAWDGELKRRSWFAQVGYRFSFQRRLLFDRFVQSIEPIVRYGELVTNLAPVPELPATWDRETLLVGAIVLLTKDLTLKFEYTLHYEDTGGGGSTGVPGDVENNEFLAQVLVRF